MKSSLRILCLLSILLLAISFCGCSSTEDNSSQSANSVGEKITHTLNVVGDSFRDFFSYCENLYLKITNINVPEYPSNHLPLYPNARVTSYNYTDNNYSIDVSCGTDDSFDTIYQYYQELFSTSIIADYFVEYAYEDEYYAYGMIGNFTFLLHVMPSNEKEKHPYTISTQLYYLLDGDLDMENTFRQLKGTNSYIFTNPYIYIYRKSEDINNIYFQLRNYKCDMLNIEMSVELYINNKFYKSRYLGDTIRVPLAELSQMCNIKMIGFDNKNCIRSFVIMDNTLIFNSNDFFELSSLSTDYPQVKNAYIYNTQNLTDISAISTLNHLEYLRFEGNNKISDYSDILSLLSLSKLFVSNVDSSLIYQLNQLNMLDILEISNCTTPISLNAHFGNLPCKEIQLTNCQEITLDSASILPAKLERLGIQYNYSLSQLEFATFYPNLHIIDISHCDNITALLGIDNLLNINMLKVNNCLAFDITQPLDNTASLVNVEFAFLPTLASNGDEYIQAISANENILSCTITSCEHTSDIYSYNNTWGEGEIT